MSSQISSPSVSYERNNGRPSLDSTRSDRAELTVELPVQIEVTDSGDKLTFPSWTPEEEAQVVTALRVAAALMPAGAQVALRVKHGPTILHSEMTSQRGDE